MYSHKDKVEDLTSGSVEILVHLAPGVSSDKTIDALYAFTDCEVSISPNCCVIDDQKPHFLTVSDVLRKSVDNTLALLRQELEIRKGEILESLHFASLEKIFIEERIYKDKEFEQAKNMSLSGNELIWLIIWLDVRLAVKPCLPVMQNLQFILQPTWEETQSVARSSSGI